MAALSLDDLYKEYEGFYEPVAKVELGGQDLDEFKKANISAVDFLVELTSDLKASIASFSLLNAYDPYTGNFFTSDLKKIISLGTDVAVYMGHSASVTEVFRGYIARVDFLYDGTAPGESVIRITAMDIKGVMMANTYSKRLKANYYSDAVKEILDQNPYQNLKNNGVVKSITISDTPDKPAAGAAGGAQQADIRIEMVGESDYEFVVKAAKKFNFEFFTIGGNVAFRKAKQNKQTLAEAVLNSHLLDAEPLNE